MNTLLAKVAAAGRAVGPYLALEILLPGGSMIALLLWLYRAHSKTLASRPLQRVSQR